MAKRLEVSLFENAWISELGDPDQNINVPKHVVCELQPCRAVLIAFKNKVA